ncbi:hypothetical protein SynRS9915_00979 [Synechococcus sp. RS9915]|nr:hypothetical protein SynRS9915_00979 [Synechococcus sp. RS9915]
MPWHLRWTENGRWHRGAGIVDWSGFKQRIHAIGPDKTEPINTSVLIDP